MATEPHKVTLDLLREWEGMLNRLSAEIQGAYGENQRGTYPPKLDCLVHFASEAATEERLLAEGKPLSL
jgi:hypothetical protein